MLAEIGFSKKDSFLKSFEIHEQLNHRASPIHLKLKLSMFYFILFYLRIYLFFGGWGLLKEFLSTDSTS